MNRANSMRLALLAGALVLSVGCHLEEPLGVSPEATGSLRVVTVLPRSLPLDQVAKVEVTVTPTQGEPVSTVLEGAGDSWGGLMRSLPPGRVGTVRARVLDAADGVVGEVSVADVELEKHRPALLVLVPHRVNPSLGSTAPIIDAVVGSRAAVSPGESIRFRVVARGAETSETLTYAWEAVEGQFTDKGVSDAEWTAPLRRGPDALTLKVMGAQGAVSTLRFSVDVALGGGWGAAHEASLERDPVVTELGARPGSQVRVGTPVELEVTAVDDDGDLLSYAWTSTCEGEFEDATSPTTRFTPMEAPQVACDNCQLSVRISDNATRASQVRSLNLCVTNPQPPTLTEVTQSSEDAFAGQMVRLSASATDPQGEPLTFAWTANTGLLGNMARGAGTGSADWVMLSCAPRDVTPTITLTVTNASGLSVTRVLVVEWEDLWCDEHAPCPAVLGASTVTLTADCTTAQTVWIPDGYTLDGGGHVLTAVDPRDGRFRGAVLSSLGTTAHVRDVTVAARGLSELTCDAGSARLRGILFDGASGSILDSVVRDVNQKEGEGGCQEGVAIEVRNARDAESVTHVEVLRNHVVGYQKAGIVGTGKVELNLEDNRVEGGGPVPFIARNGIQFSDGATGRATGNRVTGHAYTGDSAVASGILVAGGAYYGFALCEDIVLFENTVEDNDVGINLSQGEAGGGPLAVSTRLQVSRNTVTHRGPVTNGYPYQAGISDLGGANAISQNKVSGPGYDRGTQPGATFDVDVVAGAASQLFFMTPARETAVGRCSEGLVVQSQDSRGNLSALAAPSLTLEGTGPAAAGVSLFADATCTTPLATSGDGWSLVLERTQQEATFYFQAAQVGELTLTVSGDGVTGSQFQRVR
ncbi:right-handed parallel beta-helix repeat-containing protein [Myxococcus fulvus]|uniref:right-handed parallel beta-helix repeat-containing protein n=1 Tax=Myxococcus fulvus TaxID=33 RepID=UPI0020BFCC3A|nr:right-handed parallel beta-helix repeat-containing protein [Myxococcus fulvus]MCK8499983.1 right-handed parallel beta-helix repeat-containing protein [Myxococcus fulvus]